MFSIDPDRGLSHAPVMDAPYYIHTINPVLIELWGPMAIRWYGLAYVAGFAATYAYLLRASHAGRLRLDAEGIQNLLFYIVAGVMLGGRIGYLLFYSPADWARDPLMLFKVWQGGMSSHGGFLGLALAVWCFTRRRGLTFFHVADALACVGPLGIFFGRLANFVNGELWGRVTTVPWAVLFPQEAGLSPTREGVRELVLRYYEAGMIQPRHPSQLYAAAAEGLLLFGALWLLRRTEWGRRESHMTAAFFLVYAVMRVGVECFREPEIVYGGWLTQGQLLSLLLLVPVALILRSSSGRRT
jgi:phosphatidylglycerol---prolipoprotein diacylglyceryl transferase